MVDVIMCPNHTLDIAPKLKYRYPNISRVTLTITLPMTTFCNFLMTLNLCFSAYLTQLFLLYSAVPPRVMKSLRIITARGFVLPLLVLL